MKVDKTFCIDFRYKLCIGFSIYKSIYTMAKKHVGYIPKTSIDVQKVAEQVLAGLLADGLELKWYSNAQFQQDCTRLKALNLKRLQEKGLRQPLTNTLKNLITTMDKHIKYIKNYLENTYGIENAKSRYVDFGIFYKTNGYRFPTDKNERLVSLDAIVVAMDTHNFTTYQYGKAFWEDIRDQYEQALNDADTTDTSSSLTVSEKNSLIATLSKAMEAVTHILRGNFPDSYEAKMLNYGFYRSKN